MDDIVYCADQFDEPMSCAGEHLRVPLFDLPARLASLRPALGSAFDRVLESGRFILGPEVAAFEAEFAKLVGTRHAVGVANGTDALHLAIRALGIGAGDEVVLPSFTFFATAEAVAAAGATPVFCDLDPETFCVTDETVRPVLTRRTAAVIAVHLLGNVAPVAEIEALGLPVIEDAAQAAGAQSPAGRPGALGTVASFSFYPSKNLGALGDGGAVTTNDAEIAERVRSLRFHGTYDKLTHREYGYNSRLDELQAAFLRLMLPLLDEWADARRDVARAYTAAGLGELVRLPKPTQGSAPAWHLYLIRARQPDALARELLDDGIETRPYHRIPCHRQPAISQPGAADLPRTDEAAGMNLAVPMGTTLTREQIDHVVRSVRRIRAAQ